jgi:uracil-DNA glycosylase
VLTLGRRAVRLYPIFHPAAALYTPRMLETLREDFARLPALLAQGAPEQPDWTPASDIDPSELTDARAEAEEAARGETSPAPPPAEVDQLGLF